MRKYFVSAVAALAVSVPAFAFDTDTEATSPSYDEANAICQQWSFEDQIAAEDLSEYLADCISEEMSLSSVDIDEHSESLRSTENSEHGY